MKALNEKEINKFFFRTLLMFLLAALVLLIATFFGIDLHKQELKALREFKSTASSSMDRATDENLELLNIEERIRELNGLQGARFNSEIGVLRKDISSFNSENNSETVKALISAFMEQLVFIEESRNTVDKNISLMEDLKEAKEDLKDAKNEVRDLRLELKGY